jgi:hypothetical protein
MFSNISQGVSTGEQGGTMKYIICRFRSGADFQQATDSVITHIFNSEALTIACSGSVVGKYSLPPHDEMTVYSDSQDKIRELMKLADPWSAFAELPKPDGA